MSNKTQYDRVLKIVEAVNEKPDDMSYVAAYRHFGKLFYPVGDSKFTPELTDENIEQYILFITKKV